MSDLSVFLGGKRQADTYCHETSQVTLLNNDGKEVFNEKVKRPHLWSVNAALIAASKYTHQEDWDGDHINIYKMMDRVTSVFENFVLMTDTERRYLTQLQLGQCVAFNSPVYFNAHKPSIPFQSSACFIVGIEDNIESISEFIATEFQIFRGGSGIGANTSNMRSKIEKLSGSRGTSSGPLSFMTVMDKAGYVTKSGGRNRRAAILFRMDIDHPDVSDFLTVKAHEELKAKALIAAGFGDPNDMESDALGTVAFQSANNSVGLTDDFMDTTKPHYFVERVSGNKIEADKKKLWDQILDGIWKTGCPGIQFSDTMNKAHTCPHVSPIRSTNPCGEYAFIDDSACNLASINLAKYIDPLDSASECRFDIQAFQQTVGLMVKAQDYLISISKYPTEKITKNSKRYRPLGLGLTNVGGMLMRLGIPYDSDEARMLMAAITSLMSAVAWRKSAWLAKNTQPFLSCDQSSTLQRVNDQHQKSITLENVSSSSFRAAQDESKRTFELAHQILQAANVIWNEAVVVGKDRGFRNAQVTLMAPTGTIGIMMDCDSYGIEPVMARLSNKKLIGGGSLQVTNAAVEYYLKSKGWSDWDHLKANYPYHKVYHRVLETAYDTDNMVSPMGHINMMAAMQNFLSGAISKTVSLPEDYSKEDIENLIREAHSLNIKAITFYRNNSKSVQPLTVVDGKKNKEEIMELATNKLLAATKKGKCKPVRTKLPDDRAARTHRVTIGGTQVYITVGLYESGEVGELFVTVAKVGSTINGILDCMAKEISRELQYGVDLADICNSQIGSRFEPAGITSNTDIRFTSSIVDYIFKWLKMHYCDEEAKEAPVAIEQPVSTADGKPCVNCGEMIPHSLCYCTYCGEPLGCG